VVRVIFFNQDSAGKAPSTKARIPFRLVHCQINFYRSKVH
jgi:hypothetical protein